MRALLLAAGYGTRLRPLTENMPKCILPIKGKPLLGIWLMNLMKAGVGPFLINTHYLANKVSDFIENDFNYEQVTLIHEFELKGTAGTLLSNLDFFQGQDGMLIHADNYCLADFNSFIKAHINRPKECLMTMMTFRTNSPKSCGIVEVDARGIVIGFHEKVENPPGNLANGAVYILSSELIEKLGKEFKNVKDFSTEVINNFLGRIYIYETLEFFVDIGTPETYELANS
jgi:mannose-1-phosphate guanylyltransferase